MKLNKVSFYQSVELPIDGKRTNVNTLSAEVFPGIMMRLQDHMITVSHLDWEDDLFVSTANVRYATAKKDTVITFRLAQDKSSHVYFNGPDDLNPAIVKLSAGTVIKKGTKKKVNKK